MSNTSMRNYFPTPYQFPYIKRQIIIIIIIAIIIIIIIIIITIFLVHTHKRDNKLLMQTPKLS